MADGVERVFGYLQEAVQQTHSGSPFGVTASTGPNYASGEVTGCVEGEEITASIKFSVQDDESIRSEMHFNPNMVEVVDITVWARAVWDGAASKGFPTEGWKH